MVVTDFTPMSMVVTDFTPMSMVVTDFTPMSLDELIHLKEENKDEAYIN